MTGVDDVLAIGADASGGTPADTAFSALSERKYAPVAQWIEQLTSDYPGRRAVLPVVGGVAKRVELSALLEPLGGVLPPKGHPERSRCSKAAISDGRSSSTTSARMTTSTSW